MLLQIEEKRIDPDITVIELVGKLALGRESQRIETIVDELLKSGCMRVILDMTGVDYIDSAGVGLVALVSGRLKEAGGKLVAVAPEGRVLALLKMTQMTLIVTVCPTVAEATDLLRQIPR
ncbi:Anti-sigma factor antagonist [Candidatus Sulfopaludibacter sp. SbA4]|nr:Anti-sigma factor antagonist [Candidatus Sulfopaludibacter sp. SbA4]